MDNEPYDEVQDIIKIWDYQNQREKLEEKRAESRNKR